MSEETDSSAPSSGTEKLEPSAKPKKRKLLLPIIAIIVVLALIGTAAMVLMTPKHTLAVTISPTSVTVDAGKKTPVSISVLFDDADVAETDVEKILWDIEPSSLATLDRYGGKVSVSLTGGKVGGTGKVTCQVDHKGETTTVEATLKVNDPVFDSVAIDPSSSSPGVGEAVNFTATAINSVGNTMTGVTFTWSVTGFPQTEYFLNPATGATTQLKVNVSGQGNLTVTGKLGTVTKQKNATLTVGQMINRTVDYRWYNFFNVPFEPYWDVRWNKTGVEQPITDSYPYIYAWHGAPVGNVYYYSDCRLNITAKNMSEINMNSRPEFLPYLGTQRGGTAVIDWHFDYLNHDVIAARFPPNTAGWDDGWFFELSGTITLDKQAAMSVLGVTEDGWNNFATWWSSNSIVKSKAYLDWMKTEANSRLDIYPMYEYALTILGPFGFSPVKVGDKIVITQDYVSWGMEALLTRWMRESFMPTEWYMYNGDFHMTITPDYADLNYDAAVMYSLYLYETTLVPLNQDHGDPCWVWEALMQDYVGSSVAHPHSDMDPYKPFSYSNTAPGSEWYGKMMPYDYTPGTFNLTEGETMTFEWPAGEQLFIAQAFNSSGGILLGETIDVYANLTMDYSEPMDTDAQDQYIKPGTIVTDNVNKIMTFTGPIDMYNWSKHQVNHSWLKSEWDRMGILPYGAPYIEWKMESFVQPHLEHFEVAVAADPLPAGEKTDVTVTAIDQYGNVFTKYAGTVTFSSNDPGATLPANFPYTAGDAGVHTFVAETNFSLGARGTKTITVSDTVLTAATGSDSVTVVEPRRADYIVLTVSVPQIVVNESQPFTVTVYDQYDAVFTSYQGAVNFTTNATDATLPADYTFDLTDAGVKTFNVQFHEQGHFSLACTDTSNSSLTGSVDNLWVVGERPRIDHFNVYMATEINPGVGYDVTVVAISQYGEVLDTYNGTVAFASNASSGAILPSDYTFVAGDHGNKTLPGSVSFSVAGVYSLTVSDTVEVTATGTLTGITVMAWAEITYKMYDLFENPFKEWFWPGASWDRVVQYYQDYILFNDTHKHAWVYAPDPDNSEHTTIFAPYRWQIDARNVTSVNVHHPEFTYRSPAQGNVANASVKLKMTMDYISWQDWYTYWIPAFGYEKPDKPWNDTAYMDGYIESQGDGYLLGIVYDIVMNREAAYEWVGVPLAGSFATWYDNGNNIDWLIYGLDWNTWLDNEANNRLDIYAGYDDIWYPGWNWMHMEEIGSTGDVLLRIGEVDWGTEVLMTRWLTEVNLCPIEPYYENFTMYANYTETTSDVFIDAVGQYSFRAVRANQSTTNEGAWAFEPTKIDYVRSDSGSGIHPSFFDNYSNLTYTSLNPGDAFFGQQVGYDATPWFLNLSAHQKLIIQLPLGSDVPGLYGQGAPSGSLAAAQKGNMHNYTALMYNGTMSLGYFETGGVDLRPMYNDVTKTLTINGPVNFNYPRNATSELLYHGTPWIEFNVSTTMNTLSVAGPAEIPQPATSTAGALSAESATIIASVVAAASAIAALCVVLRRRE